MPAQADGLFEPDGIAGQAVEDFVPLLLPWLPAIFGGAAALLAVVILLRLVRGRRRQVSPRTSERIELQQLPNTGPPREGPWVELYSVPMRLAVVVVAPVGRIGQAPSQDRIPDLLESLLPGMKRIAAAHGPLLRTLPPQLSGKGFAHVVFGKLKLPGIDLSGDTDAQGKGTPWSMLAGRCDFGGNKLQLALVLRAERANGIGGIVLEHENQWRELLKVHGPGARSAT